MPFPKSGLPQIATVTAALVLLVIAAGALAGGYTPGLTLQSSLVRYHLYLAAVAALMLIWLTVRLRQVNVPPWVRAACWAGLVLFAIDGALMAWTSGPPVDAALAVPHAILVPLCLAAMVTVAYYIYQDWMNAPELVDISPWPSVPSIADITPVVVIFQITLGAAYRHKVFSVMPHMAGALAATLLLLVLSVLLLQNFPSHSTLRPAATAAMSVLLLQVTLGIVAFVMRLLDFDMTTSFMFIAAAHVCVGALTLAASVVLCIEVRRCCVSA
jgi:heme A synthase